MSNPPPAPHLLQRSHLQIQTNTHSNHRLPRHSSPLKPPPPPNFKLQSHQHSCRRIVSTIVTWYSKASLGRPKASWGRPKASQGRSKASRGRPKSSLGNLCATGATKLHRPELSIVHVTNFHT